MKRQRILVTGLGFLMSAVIAGAAESERLPEPVGAWLSGYVRSQKAFNGQPLTDSDVEVIATAHGDLNADQLEDLAFLLSTYGLRGANDSIQHLVVFLRDGSGLTYCCMKKVGERSGVTLGSISIAGNSVLLSGKEFVPGQDAYCCPSRSWKGRVRLNGSTLSDPIRGSTSNPRVESDALARLTRTR